MLLCLDGSLEVEPKGLQKLATQFYHSLLFVEEESPLGFGDR